MKKRKFKLIILLILLLIIPITTLSISSILVPVVKSTNSQDIKKELLNEKEKYGNIENKQVYTNSSNTKKDELLDEKITKSSEESKNNEETIISIINKFYPNEFIEIKHELDKNTINSDTYTVAVGSTEEKLYNLILDIINTKPLTSNEETILKTFMIEQYDNIKDNENLKEQIKLICQ